MSATGGIAKRLHMATHLLRQNSKSLKNMRELDRAAFECSVPVPFVAVQRQQLGRFMAPLKPLMLKGIRTFKTVQHVDNGTARVYCDPVLLNEDAKTELEVKSARLEVPIEFGSSPIEFDYDSFPAKVILAAVLPDAHPMGAFSQIGHIVHLNLREELVPYKQLIAQVLLEKTPKCRTVVNKSDIIQTKFRNFSMELLAGEPDFIATAKENGFTFEMDFEKVFWNPRLSTEHERLLRTHLKPSAGHKHFVYDVFAGIGPFSLPAAGSYGAVVFANDLNEHSVAYLRRNAELNKVQLRSVTCLDGADFIRTTVADHLAESVFTDSDAAASSSQTHHCVMNLPAIADTFLPAFVGALSGRVGDRQPPAECSLVVHVYLFTKNAADPSQAAADRVRSQLRPHDLTLVDVHHVRTVATEKEMMCVSVRLPWSALTTAADPLQPATKVPRLESSHHS